MKKMIIINRLGLRINRLNLIELLKGLTIGFLVVIGTFPENDWSFSTGIDSPLSWVFNHLYEHGLSMGRNIVFPHGPLAFFMYPLQENILIATLLKSILKVLLVFNILWLVDYSGLAKWILTFFLAYLISMVAGFNHLILANIILLYTNYYNREKRIYKLGAFILTVFAFYVKSYVAILSGIICFSFLAYYFYANRSYKNLGFDVLTIFGLLFILWFLMYGTFFGLVNYIIGMFYLAHDNSSGASYYPYNNWWILSFSLLIIFSLPFINKAKKSFFYGILITLSLFAAWKHGMAREDIYHVNGFLVFVIITLLIFLLFYNRKSFRNIALSIIAIFLLTINMKHSVNYFSPKYELFHVNNFIDFVTNFPELKSKSKAETYNKISKNKLPPALLDSIKSESVDIYPWDYSIIAANNLNWQPKVVIQSYASYTSWLDKKNAEHFTSKNAPSFLIWELDKVSKDVNGNDFNSIDDRYLLNDEPQTIVQILKNYKPYYSDKKFLVYKKREKPVKTTNINMGNYLSQWGNWITVPDCDADLLRVKLTFHKRLLQRLKSFLYKDEQFWIYLKLSNGIIHKCRIVPKNAKDGIWINPYIFNTANNHFEPSIKNIMLKCSNQAIMDDDLIVEWEKIDFECEQDYVLNFFNKTAILQDSIYISSINTFEALESEKWSKIPENQILSSDYFSGLKSHIINANSFSSTFSFPLDSLPFNDLRIVTGCWVKSKDYKYSNNISLVLSIDNNSGNNIWKGIPIDGQLIDRKRWNNIFNFIDYEHNRANCILKAYLWNTSNEEIYIDDFRVIIMGSNKP